MTDQKESNEGNQKIEEVRIWHYSPWGVVNEHLTIEVTDKVTIYTDSNGRKYEVLTSRKCEIL